MSNRKYSFHQLDVVASTNNYAMAKVHAALASHGNAYFTTHQTNGKGQRGKQWLSNNGENIAISITVQPKQLQLGQQFYLSATVALAVHQFFTKYAIDKTFIKWPNDIYWCDRKAAGILIENVVAATASDVLLGQNDTSFWKYAVIGIGININQTSFDEGLKKPVSLKQITGKQYDVALLAKELHVYVMDAVDNMQQQHMQQLMDAYNTRLYKKGQQVKMKTAGILFETTIQGVNNNGQLLTTDIIDNTFDFGTVEWVL
jgi:BirA family transcriptional regulator, biotin operon repressor / biotin---[acetyl-CoA-carboxylase] ligase